MCFYYNYVFEELYDIHPNDFDNVFKYADDFKSIYCGY